MAAYSGKMDWRALFAPRENKEKSEEEALNLLKQQLGIQADAGIEGQRKDEAYNWLNALSQDPDAMPKYTEKDLAEWYKGNKTEALKAYEQIAKRAEFLGVPLEQVAPEHPSFDPLFADNQYDAQRVLKSFEEIPEEFRVAYKPEEGFFKNLLASVIGVGQNVAQGQAYEKSKEKAIAAMMEKGLGGDEIEQMLRANQVYQEQGRSTLDKLLNISSKDGLYAKDYSQGNYKKGSLGTLYGQTANMDDVMSNFEKQYPDVAKFFKKATAPQNFQDASKNPSQWYNERFK